MAGLALAGEEQHGLAVLVLDAVEPVAMLVARHVHFHLVGRMGIELVADFGDGLIQLGLVGALAQQRGDAVEMLRREHAALREGELEDRIGRDVVPVDQFVDDVLVDAERQHRGHHLHFEAPFGGEPAKLHDAIEIALGIYLERHRLESCLRRLLDAPTRLQGLHLRIHLSSPFSLV